MFYIWLRNFHWNDNKLGLSKLFFMCFEYAYKIILNVYTAWSPFSRASKNRNTNLTKFNLIDQKLQNTKFITFCVSLSLSVCVCYGRDQSSHYVTGNFDIQQSFMWNAPKTDPFYWKKLVALLCVWHVGCAWWTSFCFSLFFLFSVCIPKIF